MEGKSKHVRDLVCVDDIIQANDVGVLQLLQKGYLADSGGGDA